MQVPVVVPPAPVEIGCCRRHLLRPFLTARLLFAPETCLSPRHPGVAAFSPVIALPQFCSVPIKVFSVLKSSPFRIWLVVACHHYRLYSHVFSVQCICERVSI